MQLTILNMTKFLLLISTFYTRRGVCIHMWYFLWLYESTWLIAIFIACGSFVLNTIYPWYIRMYSWNRRSVLDEFLLHYLWLLILPWELTHDAVVILLVTILRYIAYHGPDCIYRYYRDVRKEYVRIMTGRWMV